MLLKSHCDSVGRFASLGFLTPVADLRGFTLLTPELSEVCRWQRQSLTPVGERGDTDHLAEQAAEARRLAIAHLGGDIIQL